MTHLVDPVTGVYDRRAIMALARRTFDLQPFVMDEREGLSEALRKAWQRAHAFRTQWNVANGHCRPVPAHEVAELTRD